MASTSTLYGGPDFKPFYADGLFRSRLHAPVLRPPTKISNVSTNFVSNESARFEVSGDYGKFCSMIEHMKRHAGVFEPIGHWHIKNAGENSSDITDFDETCQETGYEISPEEFHEKYGTLEQMLDPFLGRNGMRLASESDVTEYDRFLRAIDHLGLVRSDLERQVEEQSLRVGDLGSIMDLNIILGGAMPANNEKIKVIEIGGGYGRLAEAMVNVLQGRCHYLMIDSVPAALMFAEEYLRRSLPAFSIGSFFSGDEYSDEYAVYIAPSWQVANLPGTFDVGVNIESFQEMSADHVRLYIAELSKRLGVGGSLYISNAWNYIYKGGYEIGDDFKTLYLQNTPRSWTNVHPTHLLRRDSLEHGESNQAMLRYFRSISG